MRAQIDPLSLRLIHRVTSQEVQSSDGVEGRVIIDGFLTCIKLTRTHQETEEKKNWLHHPSNKLNTIIRNRTCKQAAAHKKGKWKCVWLISLRRWNVTELLFFRSGCEAFDISMSFPHHKLRSKSSAKSDNIYLHAIEQLCLSNVRHISVDASISSACVYVPMLLLFGR